MRVENRYVVAGLFHPFVGGCSEPNDMVDDTAQEALPQYGCPDPAPDSCPHRPAGQPPLDPIHNYMSFSPDACMTDFTPGQFVRMGVMWVRPYPQFAPQLEHAETYPALRLCTLLECRAM